MRKSLGRSPAGSMGTTTRHHLSADELRRLIPKPFLPRLALLSLGTGPFTLAIFGTANNEIAMAGRVRRTLKRLAGKGETVIAVAFGFTAEALASIREAGAIPCTISDFHWTDESYASIRQATRLPRS